MEFHLKNVKFAKFASHETPCYEATLYAGGKKVAFVYNDGNGGCDMQDWVSKETQKEIEDYISTLPKIKCSFSDYEYDQDIEHICHDLLNEHLVQKDIKRMLSGKLRFVVEGEPEGSHRVVNNVNKSQISLLKMNILQQYQDKRVTFLDELFKTDPKAVQNILFVCD